MLADKVNPYFCCRIHGDEPENELREERRMIFFSELGGTTILPGTQFEFDSGDRQAVRGAR
jgi:hypothetical protein